MREAIRAVQWRLHGQLLGQCRCSYVGGDFVYLGSDFGGNLRCAKKRKLIDPYG